MTSILIVEDEIDIAKTIEFNLKKEGFTTIIAKDGEEAIEKIKKEKICIIILDIMIPRINGYQVLKHIKSDEKTKNIPVIILTAKSEEFDKLLGFEFGADDYITKPFSVKELVARIKAILKRYENIDKKNNEKIFKLKDLIVDFERKKLVIGNREIKLTVKEFMIFEFFINSNGKIITKDSLFENVWGIDKNLEIDTRTIDVHIMNLRKKLGRYGDLIKTVKGFGWRFESNVKGL
ncbi:MAG: response regulator transcription factor [Elusimicrobiota bacterium]